MHQRLYEFLEKSNVFFLYSLQFGFRSKHSTSHTLISMTEKIRNTTDNGNYGCGIFIDLAFDTVNHSTLLRKLDHYGIRGISLQWFESYLSNRNQYVSVNGHTAERLSIIHGVPQGSVLGPLLFLIFINDFAQGSKFLIFFYLLMTLISIMNHLIC